MYVCICIVSVSGIQLRTSESGLERGFPSYITMYVHSRLERSLYMVSVKDQFKGMQCNAKTKMDGWMDGWFDRLMPRDRKLSNDGDDEDEGVNGEKNRMEDNLKESMKYTNEYEV